jgi:hypothetical protein
MGMSAYQARVLRRYCSCRDSFCSAASMSGVRVEAEVDELRAVAARYGGATGLDQDASPGVIVRVAVEQRRGYKVRKWLHARRPDRDLQRFAGWQ